MPFKETIPEDRQQQIKELAEFLAVNGVRNTKLEDFHTGIFPASATGDYSDVKVVSPYGEIPWNELCRISDIEIRALMLDIENTLERFLLVYETLSDEEKTVLLSINKTQRSYDC